MRVCDLVLEDGRRVCNAARRPGGGGRIDRGGDSERVTGGGFVAASAASLARASCHALSIFLGDFATSFWGCKTEGSLSFFSSAGRIDLCFFQKK